MTLSAASDQNRADACFPDSTHQTRDPAGALFHDLKVMTVTVHV